MKTFFYDMKFVLISLFFFLGIMAFLTIVAHGEPVPMGRIAIFPPARPCDVVFTPVTRSMASSLLSFTDPNEHYPCHSFHTVDGTMAVVVKDYPLTGDELRVVYWDCSPTTAIPIVMAALAAAPKVQSQLAGTK